MERFAAVTVIILLATLAASLVLSHNSEIIVYEDSRIVVYSGQDVKRTSTSELRIYKNHINYIEFKTEWRVDSQRIYFDDIDSLHVINNKNPLQKDVYYP